MKILYFGDTNKDGTAWQRIEAMRRNGHSVSPFDPARYIPKFPLLDSLNVRTGFRLVASNVACKLEREIKSLEWDLVWVDAGAELSPRFYRSLRSRKKPIINYAIDNPFVKRDYRKWDLYKMSLPLHDLTVLKCEEQTAEAARLGARNVLNLLLCYDPVAHAPSPATGLQHDVIFVGSWMPERGPFMLKLRQHGVPLKIIGNAWKRAPEWNQLRDIWLGPSIYGKSYVEAIASSRIALGLLSKGNRDFHTSRSVEIPYIGGAILCAERTRLHEEMYRDGIEAVFWTTADECVAQCRKMLADPAGCRAMAERAKLRVVELGRSNDEVVELIFQKAIRRAD